MILMEITVYFLVQSEMHWFSSPYSLEQELFFPFEKGDW